MNCDYYNRETISQTYITQDESRDKEEHRLAKNPLKIVTQKPRLGLAQIATGNLRVDKNLPQVLQYLTLYR